MAESSNIDFTPERMMRIILSLLIALVAMPAWADWEEWGEVKGKTLFLADPATLHIDGDIRRLSTMEKLVKKGESIRRLDEYDCRTERTRTLTMSYHDAKGGTVYENSAPTRWEPIPRETLLSDILKRVCQR